MNSKVRMEKFPLLSMYLLTTPNVKRAPILAESRSIPNLDIRERFEDTIIKKGKF